MHRINVGCGLTPTQGWRNFDNSPSIRLARLPSFLALLLRKCRLIDENQYRFIEYARHNDLEYADVTRLLPLENASVDVLYSSHMFEHLDRAEAAIFLAEARRVLRPGGIIRLSVPDIAKLVSEYLDTKDADRFVTGTHMAVPKPKGGLQRTKTFLLGTRHHHWMYDGASLSRLLIESGFELPQVMEPGRTRIPEPQALDLFERAPESVYVEALRA